MSEPPDQAWESDDSVRRTMIMPAVLAERRELSVSELLIEYAEEGLRRGAAGS